MRFHAEVSVSLKPVVNDPQGLVIRDGLRQLGFDGVREVRAGKQLVLKLEADDAEGALALVDAMCRRLLVNPVIEEAQVTIRAASTAAP